MLRRMPRMFSSQRTPSLVAHWKPATTESLISFKYWTPFVTSTSRLGPVPWDSFFIQFIYYLFSKFQSIEMGKREKNRQVQSTRSCEHQWHRTRTSRTESWHGPLHHPKNYIVHKTEKMCVKYIYHIINPYSYNL